MLKSVIAFAVATVALSVAKVSGAEEQVRHGKVTYTFQDRRFADVFKRTLIFGHTISADFMKPVVSLADGPGTVLSEVYAQSKPIANISEPRAISHLEFFSAGGKAPQSDAEKCLDPSQLTFTEMLICEENKWSQPSFRGLGALWRRFNASINLESGLRKIFRWTYQYDDKSLASRRLSFMNNAYELSTAIVGVDAFYMAATQGFDGECDEYSVERTMDHFTQKTFRDGKVLVLGNVPLEDYSGFSLANRIAIFPQDETCRQRINTALTNFCTAERNCYVVDLETAVKELNRDGYLYLNDRSRPWTNIRPDGVNLGDRGVQYVVEKVLNAMHASPPRSTSGTGVLRVR